MLTAAGAGAPASLFYRAELQDWAQRLDVTLTGHGRTDLGAVFAAARRRGMARTQIFGLRQQWPGFPFLCQQLAQLYPEGTTRTRLAHVFGPLKFVYLQREDKLAQAVSLIRARQTGLWHRAADGSDYERLPPEQDEGFDAEQITQQIALLRSYDAGWQSFFAAEGLEPLVLHYEALAADPKAGLRRCLGFVGLDVACAEQVTVPVQKLADETSATWIARYRRSHV